MLELLIPKTKRVLTGSQDKIAFEVPTSFLNIAKEVIKAGLEKSGDTYYVNVRLPFTPRSTGELSQNHALNGFIQKIAVSTGNDFADVKLYIKRRAFSRGLPFLQNANGEIVRSLIDGEPLPISESSMSKEQCGWCIDVCNEVAAEFGVAL